MTDKERKEALELLHELWGLHAEGKYEKSTVKSKWARLDQLLRQVTPIADPSRR